MTTDEMIGELDRNCRAYTSLMRAAVRVQLQITAHERTIKKWHQVEEEALVKLFSLGVIPHLHAAIIPLLEPKKHYEKVIADLAKQLPLWPWAEKIRGVGPKGLGLMIGEIGNPGDYANPAKIWKRMGLAVMPDGRAQRRVTGFMGELQGFSPVRRALMYVIGDALIKRNKNPDGSDGEYRLVYLARKEYESARTAPIVVTVTKYGKSHQGDITRLVCHKRASRYMQKRVLRDLWRAWRACCPMAPTQDLLACSSEVS